MRRRWLGVGAGLAGIYILVVVGTMRLSPQAVRPLFDGFAPPVPYNWVDPPPGFPPEGATPSAGELDVALGPDGSEDKGAGTPDGQAFVALEAGSVPGREPDTAVKVRIDPFDAQTLGPLPPGLRIHSNAYRVTFTYQPSATPLAALARPASVSLTSVVSADILLFSSDGGSWRVLPSTPFGNSSGLTAASGETGYFLVARAEPGDEASPTPWWRTPWPYLAAAVGAAVIVSWRVATRSRRRRPDPRSRPSPPVKRRSPSAKSKDRRRRKSSRKRQRRRR